MFFLGACLAAPWELWVEVAGPVPACWYTCRYRHCWYTPSVHSRLCWEHHHLPYITPLTLHLRALQTIGHKCAVICAIQYNNISCYEWNLPRELVILMWKTTFIIFSPTVQSFLWCDKNPGECEDIFHLFVLLSEITYFIILNVFEGTLLDNRNNKWLPVIS